MCGEFLYLDSRSCLRIFFDRDTGTVVIGILLLRLFGRRFRGIIVALTTAREQAQ